MIKRLIGMLLFLPSLIRYEKDDLHIYKLMKESHISVSKYNLIFSNIEEERNSLKPTHTTVVISQNYTFRICHT